MKRIESIEDRMKGVVTYELPDGRMARFDARAVEEHGIAKLMRAYDMGHLLPTERLPVIHHGRRVGTMAPDFDPNNIKTPGFLYQPRLGDFTRVDDAWIACRTLGIGDIEMVDGFEPDAPK
jgi:hypothetical protein